MKKRFDMVVVGFALFAMFFGAGNLIFPPYLGLSAGPEWLKGFVFYSIADIGVALFGIFAMIRTDGDMDSLTGRVGKIPALLINSAAVLCIGPIFAIPRTGATSFEIGVQPIFENFNSIIFSLIYFGIVFALTIRPSKVVDIIGKILTPLLLILLVYLIIRGVMTPIGSISKAPLESNVVANGLIAGYQTLDAFAAMIFGIIIIQAVKDKGYTKGGPNSKAKVVIGASVVAAVCLIVVYGGLTYLGATVSTTFDMEINQSTLLITIVNMVLGKTGATILGIIVILACLTTAIGLTSATAAYFEKITSGKLKYSVVVVIVTVLSILISNIGLSAIIAFAVPVLLFLYPIVLTVIFTSFASGIIKNDNTIRGAVLFAAITSLFTVLHSYGISFFPIEKMPLFASGLNWIIPAVIGGLLGTLIKTGKKETEENVA
ncbi:MAG: branched-chain amino acid transport system II carrier protein [Clostridiales Family XIII bacterium]|jgi:LIVCS family branched-chain amino acid:cation transporter|nr:branched-chain amino acid transport system II carrier protein [Clostridiales Family XIII bacterium]